FWMRRGLVEQVIEVFAAAVVRLWRRLRRAVWAVGRAVDPHVEVIVMPPPWPHLAEPAPVVAGVAAQRFLDRRIDEDTGDFRILRRRPDDRRVRRRPHLRVDI